MGIFSQRKREWSGRISICCFLLAGDNTNKSPRFFSVFDPNSVIAPTEAWPVCWVNFSRNTNQQNQSAHRRLSGFLTKSARICLDGGQQVVPTRVSVQYVLMALIWHLRETLAHILPLSACYFYEQHCSRIVYNLFFMCAFFQIFKNGVIYSQNNQTHRNISKYLNNYVHKNLQPCLIFYKSYFS